MIRYIPLFLLFVLLLACTRPPEEVDLILLNATIVDVKNNTTIPDQLIAIRGDSVFAVDHSSNSEDYLPTQTIDLLNKYVMPGLWDNHVHFRGGEELVEANRDLLSLYLAFGITTVRDGGGDITPAIRQWQKEIASGYLPGPDIFTSGPKLDGNEPAWDGSIEITDEQSVTRALDSLESIQADFVKMYDGNLTAQQFYTITKEAQRRGLKTTGHMPLSADLITAVDQGLDGTEHLYYVLKASSPVKDSLSQIYDGYGMLPDLLASYDSASAHVVYQQLAEQDFFVTPTLHIGKTLAELNITDHSNDFMLDYISPDIIETYQRRINSAKRGGESYTRQRALMTDVFISMVKPMHDAGILLLAGSDSGPFNSYTYPGESIHKELRLLVESGLTPQEALITSIINGPKFFDLEEHYGSVEPGKTADLLILHQNPLDDIRNTDTIVSVYTHGEYYSITDLNQLLEQIKNQ